MADIKKKVVFSKEQKTLIEDIVKDESFSHNDWTKVEKKEPLQALRSYIRKHYRTEQMAKCAYCKKDVSVQSASNCQVEHIAPKEKYKDYMFHPKNLCVACADCNAIKWNRDTIKPIKSGERKRYPSSSRAFLLVHPHFDDYTDHIDIFSDRWYVDKTKKGHFTIGLCKLNQRSVDFGYFEPDEMMVLAEDLRAAKANGSRQLVGLIKDRIRKLLDD
ncbi:HNH endonuclease [Aliivibrio fischeri]|uniref:HNH endonuclease n=1 Tax=Aliivibrio fischeri TaxID=668 RepID=UPI0007C4BC3C|nr:HNH endonuclease domain-containing protein [Aliivibrio fischeri]